MKYTRTSTITTRPRKYSLEQIAELYQSGTSTVGVGKLLGIHHTTVMYALDQLNIPRQSRPQPKREALKLANRLARAARDARACEMYGKGWSTVDIAEELDVHVTTIRDALKASGVELTQTGKWVRRPKEVAEEQPWRDFSEYRAKWRAQHAKGPGCARIERMMKITAPRRSRFAA